MLRQFQDIDYYRGTSNLSLDNRSSNILNVYFQILIIGGGIANFTNVADTFKGVIRAIREAKSKLRENNTKVFVRRGGPNHLEGLRLMRELGGQIDLPIHVYGPETHMTAIVAMALGQEPIEDPTPTEASTAEFSLPTMVTIDF